MFGRFFRLDFCAACRLVSCSCLLVVLAFAASVFEGVVLVLCCCLSVLFGALFLRCCWQARLLYVDILSVEMLGVLVIPCVGVFVALCWLVCV